jgi:FtsP/CotA-like multicopper oxidase with cupredoxin domain
MRSLPVLLVVIAVAGSGCKKSDADRLLDEFSGAYAESAHPSGTVRSFELIAGPAEIGIAGQPKLLRVWAYNKSVPGPILRVRVGDTVRVKVTNELPQPTTIHWHGIRVPNAMDGVPTETQPAIAPNASFTYEFVPKDAGTFWFHPHIRSSEQVERGLYGVLIVEDKEPAPYSADVVWVLDDWLLDRDGQIAGEFNTIHDLMHDGRWGNLITVNSHPGGETLRARSGDRIRLRMVNTANGRVFKPDFGDLDAKLIAVDGMYLRSPISAANFELAPGNRIDVDISLNDFQTVRHDIVDRYVANAVNPLGAIEVDGIATSPPHFDSPAHAKVPAWRGGAASAVTRDVKLDAKRGGPMGITWMFDDRPFAGHEQHAEPLFTLTAGQFAHLRFKNESYRLHPIHIHGMFFRVLARNGEPVDEPFFRDTALVHSEETVDLGVVPIDPGEWMMHCHILEHAEAGMMTTIAVVPPLASRP